MIKKVSKRGVSPTVASVFLVLLMLVLAAIVFLWAKGFFGEQIDKFGGPIQKACDQASFEISKDGSELEILNTGNVDIHYFDIKFIKRGNSEIKKFGIETHAGRDAAVREYVTFEMEDGTTPDQIIVYPVLLGTSRASGENNVFTCLENGVILN
jgi:hypothetical protein